MNKPLCDLSTEERRAMILDLAATGMRQPQIADQCATSQATVSRTLSAYRKSQPVCLACGGSGIQEATLDGLRAAWSAEQRGVKVSDVEWASIARSIFRANPALAEGRAA